MTKFYTKLKDRKKKSKKKEEKHLHRKKRKPIITWRKKKIRKPALGRRSAVLPNTKPKLTPLQVRYLKERMAYRAMLERHRENLAKHGTGLIKK